MIVTGLRATTARIVADRRNLDSYAGQTALVTLHGLLAMLGLQIDLDIPAMQMIGSQPPLRGGDLRDALRAYAGDLIPGGADHPAPVADITFALGDSHAPDAAVRVSGTAVRALITTGNHAAIRWSDAGPIGAMAAAAAAAAEGARAAVLRTSRLLDLPTPASKLWLPGPRLHVDLDLSPYADAELRNLGPVDIVSAGAITHSALYTLLRLPGTRAEVRVVDSDTLQLGNLNRYPLAKRSHCGDAKVDALATYSTDEIRIHPHPVALEQANLPFLRPLAPRVLVGVDHIPSRWLAQQEALNGWVCVGATSHDYVLVTVHPAGQACAGCTHPKDDTTPGTIPTISFVSFWAGFIQALELRSAARRPSITASGTHAWPLGLSGPRGLHQYHQQPVANCPVQCPSSRRAA